MTLQVTQKFYFLIINDNMQISVGISEEEATLNYKTPKFGVT